LAYDNATAVVSMGGKVVISRTGSKLGFGGFG
jgi:hypothetical protein